MISRLQSINIFNAYKFVLKLALGDEITPLAATAPVADPAEVTNFLDRTMLAALADVVDEAGAAFERYDHTRALELTESLFRSEERRVGNEGTTQRRRYEPTTK